MGWDVAIAHVATYYNPLMYIPFYYAVKAFEPRTLGFLLGLLPGLNIWLLYAIARQSVTLESPTRTAAFALAAAGVGMLGAINLAEVGTSYFDNVVSLPLLAAVWLILRHRRRLGARGAWPWTVSAVAGFLAGAAFGLKLPYAVYAVGMCAAFFGLPLPWRRRFMLAFVFGLGVLAGTAATAGFWMLEMWERFQNPVFPYFNEFFRSPWGAEGSYRDDRFIPKSLFKTLLFPFWFTADPLQVGEVPFRDLRLPLLYLALLALLFAGAWRRFSGRPTAAAEPGERASDPTATRFLAVFLTTSFFLWMKLFAVYRYAIVCELLAPLALFAVLGALCRNRRRQLRATLGAFLLIVSTLEVASWGRRPWGADYFGVDPPPIADPSDTIVLATGHDPVAYMIPFFPPEVRFLRIQGYLTGPSPKPNESDRLMQGILARHKGPFFTLYRDYGEWSAANALKAYGFEIDRSGCRKWVPHVEPQQEHPFFLCPAVKAPGA
jgi:hypothetical protein